MGADRDHPIGVAGSPFALPRSRIRGRAQHPRRAQAHPRDRRTKAIANDLAADAVVVGAGHNGLVAANYLARAGLRVVVCERREVVGGATVTEEIAPGFRVSTASYALSLLRPDICKDLELGRHGLVATAKDPQMFVPLRDGRYFFVWRDPARTHQELARIHPPDADAYERWCAFWAEATPVLRSLLEDPDPPHPKDVLAPELYRLAVVGSAADLVSAFFEDPEIQGAFASQGIIGTSAGVRDPGTAWVLSYHALGGEIYGSDGTWGFARGGMGAVSGALASAAGEAGVQVLKGSPVTEILLSSGRATGVRLASGRVVRSHVVLSGADPKTTFEALLPAGSLEATFARRVKEWRTPGCVLKVNMAVAELPDFLARPGSGPQQLGTLELAGTVDDLQEAYDEAVANGFSSSPFIEMFVGSALDPTLVEGEGHVVSAFTQYVQPEGRHWEGIRAQAVEAVVAKISSFAPNVRHSVIAVEALGPPELQERFGLAGGNIFHGELTPDQSFAERFDYPTPIDGLYLCGSGARPGGCVMGAAGRNAARRVVEDLKASPSSRDSWS